MPEDMPSSEQLLELYHIPHLDVDASGWLKVRCVNHAEPEGGTLETDAHAAINESSGVVNCFKCGHKGGIWDFLKAYLQARDGISYDQKALQQQARDLMGAASGTIPKGYVETCNMALTMPAGIPSLKKLATKGITWAMADKYNLGYDAHSDRITIPTYSQNGELANIRLYKPGHKAKYKNWPGCGRPRLYLDQNLLADEVFVVEGELKAILATERGFHAVAPTGGASKWEQSWTERFAGKRVRVVYDVNDMDDKGKVTNVGQKSALHVCTLLSKVADEVKNIVLPLGTQFKGGDITNYFIDCEKSAEDFRKLVEATQVFAPPTNSTIDDRPDDPQENETTLAGASDAKWRDKRVTFEAIVSAKAEAPYVVPTVVKVRCPRGQKEYCSRCEIINGPDPAILTLDPSHGAMLEMIDVPAEAQAVIWKGIGGIYPKCTVCHFDPITNVNLEELVTIPQIAAGFSTDEQATRKVFVVGRGLEANAAFTFTARSTVDPRSQKSVQLAYKSTATRNRIGDFALKLDLSLFQASTWTADGVRSVLADIYEDLAHNVSHIYERPDMHLFCDLVWHSALFVPFQGRQVKGWVDALIIGDSGQGKSETASALRRHYGCGERIDSKRASAVGLLGGVDKEGNKNYLRWGAIPLNDGRLVVLEELKGMAPEAIAVLTDMRSSGVAEVRKIAGGKTNARTRLLSITNSRSGRKLGEYAHGVEAVREVMGALEDVRRLDMAMGVCSGEVSNEIVNRGSGRIVPHHATSELCGHLVAWAWSRGAHQIRYEPAAVEAILETSLRMGARYTSAIPLVEASDQRMKLARLSAALAARTFSTDDGETLIVRAAHVEVIEDFLDRIYAAPGLNYAGFSDMQRGDEASLDATALEREVRSYANAAVMVVQLLNAELITPQDWMDVGEADKETAGKCVGMLVRMGALRRLKNGYRKVPGFTALLKRLAVENIGNVTKHAKIVQNSEI